MTVSVRSDSDPDLLPRYQRRQKRRKDDRGLPPDEVLVDLATIYLKEQSSLWPKQVKAGVIPVASSAVIKEMVENFKSRHRGGDIVLESFDDLTRMRIKLAAGYGRYSCDNSNPTSISDQMVNWLRRAHADNHFIPWAYVFADYSVSGLDSERLGYTACKAAITDKNQHVTVTYIDDFTRASRDTIEWWKLAETCQSLRKGLIGASDGFDLNSQQGEILMFAYTLLSRLFIKGLREKVRRGMSGASRRGTVLGRLPLGFSRKLKRDAIGNVVHGADGAPIHEPAIDPETEAIVKTIFTLFIEKLWSFSQIAMYLNTSLADNWNGWTAQVVRKILRNPAYLGVFIWNRYRRESGIKVRNDRSDWSVLYRPELRIISLEHWRAAQRRLSEMRRASGNTGRKRSRNEKRATTLLSGTLFCEHCGRELVLYRSSGKYKQFFCFNGPEGVHGCKLTTSKSARTIENCLLPILRDSVISGAAISALVKDANGYLLCDPYGPASALRNTPVPELDRPR